MVSFGINILKNKEIFKSRNKMKNYIFICIKICLIIV